MTPTRRARREFSRTTDLRRHRATREERRRLLILCEGKTERRYFEGMRTRRGPVLDVKDPDPDPLHLIHQARKRRDGDDYNEVWCVFDVDGRELAPALNEARDKQVAVAISNP